MEKAHVFLLIYFVFLGLCCQFKHKDFLHLLFVGGAEYFYHMQESKKQNNAPPIIPGSELIGDILDTVFLPA